MSVLFFIRSQKLNAYLHVNPLSPRMSNLISIIPHTGYGAALFPFLDARDLDNLKRTCKILNQDVKAHVDR